MWFDEAQNYVIYAILIAGVFLAWAWRRPRQALRTVSMLALGFAIGLYVGIGTTAKGWFLLPLSVMQKQLHEQWQVPVSNLRHPIDRE